MTSPTLPMADIVAVPLTGEPATDKAFRDVATDFVYRVRVVPVAQAAEALPTNDSSQVAPFIQFIDISVVRLGDNGLPVRDGQDRLVGVKTTWSIAQANMEADWDPADELMKYIRNQIWSAARIATGPVALSSLLADWGATPADVNTLSSNFSVPSQLNAPEIFQPTLPEVVHEGQEQGSLGI